MNHDPNHLYYILLFFPLKCGVDYHLSSKKTEAKTDLFGNKEEEDFEKKADSAFRKETFLDLLESPAPTPVSCLAGPSLKDTPQDVV